MNMHEYLLGEFRGFRNAMIIIDTFLLLFGICVAIFFDGHTMFRRVALSLCCIVPAVVNTVMAIRMYKEFRGEVMC